MPEPLPSRRAREVAPFRAMALLARARELEAQGRRVIHLEVGEPDFGAPGAVVAAARRALARGRGGYTPAGGLPELRAAIAARYRRLHGLEVDPGRVLVTPGASGALLLALALVADPGEGLLLTDPGYPCFPQLARVLGLQGRSLPLEAERGYRPDPEAAARSWTPATRALVLASPANPTGTVLSLEELAALRAVAAGRGGWLVVDETYAGLAYEGPTPTALAAAGEGGAGVLVAGSFSKHFGMTGWRVGWLVVPQGAAQAAERLAQNLYLAAPTLAQHAALAALDPALEPELAGRVAELRRRRDYLAGALRALGFTLPELPGGAFYLYVGCERLAEDSEELARRLLEEAGVAVTPGTDFGRHRARERLRVAYTAAGPELEEAVRRLAAFLGKPVPGGKAVPG